MTGVKIEGAARLRSTLRRAGADLSDIKAANRAAAAVVLGPASATAPKRVGRLAASVRIGATNKAGIIRAGNGRKSGGVPYAGVIHWGWPKHGIKPRPWIATAAKATEPQWIPIYEIEMRRAVAKVKGK